MSSRKRSRNSNEEENKENDNRNPFFPKKPITTTLFEQRQAQINQNRAAGKNKRWSENTGRPDSPVPPGPLPLMNAAKIWNQNLPVGVADGRSENLGVQNLLKKQVPLPLGGAPAPSFKPGIFAPAPSDAPGIFAHAPSVAPGIFAPAPSGTPGIFSKAPSVQGFTDGGIFWSASVAPGILAPAPSVAPSVQLHQNLPVGVAGGRSENLRVYNPVDVMKEQVSSLKSGSGSAYAPPVSPVTPVAPAPPVSLDLEPQHQNRPVGVAGGSSENLGVHLVPIKDPLKKQVKPPQGSKVTNLYGQDPRGRDLQGRILVESKTTTSSQEKTKTNSNSIQERPNTTSSSIQERPNTTGSSIQERPKTTTSFQERPKITKNSFHESPDSTTSFQDRPKATNNSIKEKPITTLNRAELHGQGPPCGRDLHGSKITTTFHERPNRPVGVASTRQLPTDYLQHSGNLGGVAMPLRDPLQHLTELVATPLRQRHQSQPVNEATPLRQRHPSQPVGAATPLRGGPQPVWRDDPTKQLPEGSFDRRDWECLYMPMEEVIGRMVYQGPKKRGFFDFKYSFGAPNHWSEAYLYSRNKGCDKPLNESKWYYCDCSVWCKCVECFCHKIWPDVEN